MRLVGTTVRGIRTPIIKENDDLANIVVSSLVNASKEEGFSFSDKNKIPNSYKNKNENFADCFADWLINNKETKERNNDMEKILLEKGLLKY